MKQIISAVILSMAVATGYSQETEKNLDKWAVHTLHGKEVPTQIIYFSIDPATSRVFGSSGCNNFSGEILMNTKKQTVKTQKFMSTMMMCEGDRMKWEDEFLQTITDKNKLSYKFENRVLKVYSRKEEIMTLHKYNDSANAVGNPSYTKFIQENNWNLIQIDGKEYKGNDVTMQFDMADHRVSGKSACNNYFGGYKITGHVINFSQIGGTRMMCENEKNKVEKRFLEILSTPEINFDAADQTFNLYIDNKLVLMFGVVK